MVRQREQRRRDAGGVEVAVEEEEGVCGQAGLPHLLGLSGVVMLTMNGDYLVDVVVSASVLLESGCWLELVVEVQ